MSALYKKIGNPGANRRATRVHVEIQDSGARPDAEVAREWWDAHLARNFSVVTCLFDGQLKGKTTCSKCGYTSARFEPFRFLPVPLPR